ncbi:MAG: prepilin-type N-terminal cleavage/methylation domain-containing protein [Patescibacteria group bacterium]
MKIRQKCQLRENDQTGFTLPEIMVVLFVSSLFSGLLLFFMVSYWRYGLLLESDLDTLTTRLNAGDFLRENLNPASGLIIQNSIEDTNSSNPDPAISPAYYWLPIHAIPGVIPMGSSGTSTSVAYFKRPSINTSGAVILSGIQPYEDEFILYMDGSTKSLMSRSLANPSAPGNRLKTSCPPAIATTACPADRTVASDISSLEMRYFSKTGNLIDYTSSYDTDTNMYTGPDFPVAEVVEFKLNLTKKPLLQTANATFNTTIIRVALRNK